MLMTQWCLNTKEWPLHAGTQLQHNNTDPDTCFHFSILIFHFNFHIPPLPPHFFPLFILTCTHNTVKPPFCTQPFPVIAAQASEWASNIQMRAGVLQPHLANLSRQFNRTEKVRRICETSGGLTSKPSYHTATVFTRRRYWREIARSGVTKKKNGKKGCAPNSMHFNTNLFYRRILRFSLYHEATAGVQRKIWWVWNKIFPIPPEPNYQVLLLLWKWYWLSI